MNMSTKKTSFSSHGFQNLLARIGLVIILNLISKKKCIRNLIDSKDHESCKPMTVENVVEKNTVGKLPMSLAESACNGRVRSKRIFFSALQKILVILFIVLLTIGIYVAITRFLMTNDNVKTSQRIVISDITEPIVLGDEIELIIIAKNKSKSKTPLSRKQRYIKTRSTINDNSKRVVKFKDSEIQKARKIISEHHMLCNENNHKEICKDLVTKLKYLTQHDSNISRINSKLQNEDDNTIEKNLQKNTNPTNNPNQKIQKDILRPTKSVPVIKSNHYEPSNIHPNSYHNHYHTYSNSHLPMTETCLLARMLKQTYPHIHGIYDSPAVHHEYQQSYPRYHSPGFSPSYDKNYNAIMPKQELHPQDIEIAKKLINAKSQPKEVLANVTIQEIECPEDMIACNNGDACINTSQLCDRNVDCSDVSDEIGCDCKSRVDQSRICDGYFDCPYGEDEMGCDGCDLSEFSCGDFDTNSKSICFNKDERCNNIGDCPNRKDEIDCNMLAPGLNKNSLFSISKTEGYLQRNFKGNWYAVCNNPYMWAHDVCRRETGLIIRPPFIQFVQIDPSLKVDYIDTAAGGLIETSNTCLNSSAVYVTCPDLICGTRLPSTWQKLKEDLEENQLFGRNKRKILTNNRSLKTYATYKNWKSNVPLNYSEAKIDEPRVKRADTRMVGGKPSQPASWPWMAALYRDGKFHCGGVIINQNWIMSAAHCVHTFWEHYYEVEVGMLRRFSFSPQEQTHRVTHIIANQDYDPSNIKNDLSLLKVEPGIQYSRWIRPVCLPNPEVAGPNWLWGPPAGTMCTVVGWGATVEQGPDPDHLREVEVPIWNHCKHPEDQAGNEICAGLMEGGKDSCQGDSGGPLLCQNPTNAKQWYVAGIVSHGHGCGRKNEPGVYTRVSLFVHWIKHHTSSSVMPAIIPKQECPGYRCDSGILKCLPKKRMCDKIIDCLDGEDEINCELQRSASSNELLNYIKPDKLSLETAKSNIEKNNIESDDFKNEPETVSPLELNILTEPNLSNLQLVEEITTPTELSTTENYNQFSTNPISIIASSNVIEFSTTEIINSDSSITTPDYKNTQQILNENVTEESVTVFRGDEIENENGETTTSRSTDYKVFTEAINNVFTTDFNSNIDLSSSIESDEKLRHDTNISNETNKTETVQGNKELAKNNSNINTTVSLNEQEILDSTTQKLNIKNLDSYNDFDTNVEKNIFSALHPAKIRKKHQIPQNFECQNIPQSIPYRKRCDEKPDCEDGTDEADCSCNDYLTTLDSNYLCNGILDCADGQDEMDCLDCENDEYVCKLSGMCVPIKNVCDGKKHCPLGEDELDCLTLSNGKQVLFDINGRPEIRLEGYLTTTQKHNNDWRILCRDNYPQNDQDDDSTYVCRYLGFSSVNRHKIKYINIKNNDLSDFESQKSTRVRRTLNDKSNIKIKYIENNLENERFSSKNLTLTDLEVVKEQCVPNITKTCMALYVFCDTSLFTNFELKPITSFQREAQSHSYNVWPWVAQLFVDGNYQCTGVLVDFSWVLVHHLCLKTVLLSHHYLTVVLGSYKTLNILKGPYEQVYQVDTKKELYLKRVVLLHLKAPAKYSAMVKPMIVTSSHNYNEKNETCITVGRDKANNTITLFFKKNEDCNFNEPCFTFKENEDFCQIGALNEWSGIISCQSSYGWYPAAAFEEAKEICSSSGNISANLIDNLNHEIKWFEQRLFPATMEKWIENCSGVRCQRGRCIELYDTCNGVLDCEDGSDESKEMCAKKNKICSKDPFYRGCACPVGKFKCGNGQCVAKSLFKDGNNDCGDNSDEPGTNVCFDYLSKVMPSRLCDGILHCEDRSDENPKFCKCFAKKGFSCGKESDDEKYCIAMDMVCDGVRDCSNGKDEKTCIGLHGPEGTPHGVGEVIVRSHGVWHSKCFSTTNHTKMELEKICRDLGFLSGHAKQLDGPVRSMTSHPHNDIVIDKFSHIELNNKTRVKLRNTYLPLARAVFDRKEQCYPLFIECL